MKNIFLYLLGVALALQAHLSVAQVTTDVSLQNGQVKFFVYNNLSSQVRVDSITLLGSIGCKVPVRVGSVTMVPPGTKAFVATYGLIDLLKSCSVNVPGAAEHVANVHTVSKNQMYQPIPGKSGVAYAQNVPFGYEVEMTLVGHHVRHTVVTAGYVHFVKR